MGTKSNSQLLGIGLTIVCLGLGLLVRGWWRGRGKQAALDHLSEAISQAIHQLVNKPQPTAPTASWDAFADTLAQEYSKWCEGVDRVLANTAYFTRSDALHFQRLGVFPPVIITQHPGADHTLAMLTEKINA